MMFEVVSRDVARERGMVRYFTGQPCRNGHVCQRRVGGGHCVECVRASQIAMKVKLGPDGFKAKQKIWDETYRDKNPARKLANSKAASARMLERDPDYFRRHALDWNRTHATHVKEVRLRRYRDMKENDPEALKMRNAAHNAARRVKQRLNRTSELTKIIGEIWDRCGGKCICGSGHRIELDHVVPVSRGGTNAKSNFQFLCFSCNRSKRAKDFHQWLDEMTAPEGVAA